MIGDVHAAWHRLFDGLRYAHREHGVQAAIQVGDFGFFRQYDRRPLGDADRFRLPIPLHVIDGNHEDHTWLRACIASGVVKEWAENQNIVVQARGTVARIGDLVVGFCGGALHVDRPQKGSIDRRTTNWVTRREAQRAAEIFSREHVDLVVTHSCPHSIGVGMVGNPILAQGIERHITRNGFNAGPITDCGEPGLLNLWEKLQHRPREWVFGHFHVHRTSEIGGVRFRCIGAIDGSDHHPEPVMYVLETSTWDWCTIPIGIAT